MIYQAYSPSRGFTCNPTPDPYEAEEACEFENKLAEQYNNLPDWIVRKGTIQWME